MLILCPAAQRSSAAPKGCAGMGSTGAQLRSPSERSEGARGGGLYGGGLWVAPLEGRPGDKSKDFQDFCKVVKLMEVGAPIF